MLNHIKNTVLVAMLLLSACTDSKIPPVTESKDSTKVKLFEKVPSDKSGITFNNLLVENFTYNHIRYDVVYQGAGVATGDINNDGLPDFFITSNMKPDKLYLNKGGMQFEDITEKAGIVFDGKWSTGVTMADVNSDGLLDIYVCKYLLDKPENRANSLYINNGDLTFTEKAKEYGIADMGYATTANFFDYNKDGHLDLYVGNQPPVSRLQKTVQSQKIDYTYTDRLFKNNGNGTFTDVTEEAGITNYNFTLAVTVSDINNDTWPDIYIACDFEEPDVYYQNNGDGTFTNVINDAMRHISTFSMGVDIADVNNDGWMDIYVADMVAADNQRLKANMSGMNPQKFWALAKAGYHHQYMFNAFQINNGNGKFSEIGQMAGISNTDWSWATLFADYDNDGLKDLVVTNGLVKDIKNNDYRRRRKALMDSLANDMRSKGMPVQLDPMQFINLAPSVKLHNYVFRNNGDLTFADMSIDWGLEEKTWTHGAAYADFDGDGDVDIIMNHMNDIAGLYENKAVDLQLNNYLRIKLNGDKLNTQSIGARAWIYHGDEMQVQEVSPMRGYFSRNEEVLHFGVGAAQKIDKIIVRWQDGKGMELKDVSVNQLLTLDHADAKSEIGYPKQHSNSLMKAVDAQALGVDFEHSENEFDDFAREILLPHRMSRLGPSVDVADVNGDDLEDFFIGGPSGQAGALYLQKASGKFEKSASNPWETDKVSEDVGALFFDADGDGDQDLYVSSGGNDFDKGALALQDRLYINDGKGNFSKSLNALPKMLNSSSKAKAADYDGDGDLDLFVGGRQIPGHYGYSTTSYLLKNNKGKFENANKTSAPGFEDLGMVTDAVWTDFDGDNDLDLIIVGEWMTITFYKNESGKLEDITAELSMENTNGWWNTISAADFDGDGDEDYVIGNLGLNIKYKASEDEPFKVFVKDFDGNGTHDVYLAYYDQDGVCYPVRGRECSSQQLPFIKKEFPSYGKFSVATVDQVLGERKDGAVEKQVKIFESIYLENRGGNLFVMKKLPNEAQVSPIFGAVAMDCNDDGHLDILAAGNYYEREVETTRSDAGIGIILAGDGKGNFEPLPGSSAGLNAYKDVRDVKVLNRKSKNPIIIIANNDSGIEFYQKNTDSDRLIGEELQ